jgi:hypothetical protein
MMANIKDAKNAMDRWFDVKDMPPEAIIEMDLLLGGYNQFVNAGYFDDDKATNITVIVEMCIACFRIGQAHPHEPLK